MPRQARLDAPGTLHHVILRGIERGRIVADAQDRAAFVARLGTVATATGMVCYAWALLSNHAHLLLRSGPAGLPPAMRRFLTGYAGAYNRRHHRHGHLFQNRYKSIVVEEDGYFRELVRYLHLNPLRAGLVPDVQALDRYPWCGHHWLMHGGHPPWYARADVLGWFGRSAAAARRAYRAFLAEGVGQGRRPELVGGGLIRSLGGWAEVRGRRQRGDATRADPRILGSDGFVERVLAEAHPPPPGARARLLPRARALVHQRCAASSVGLPELQSGSRRAPVVAVRGRLAQHLVAQLGLSLADTARLLGVSTSGIAKALAREGIDQSD